MTVLFENNTNQQVDIKLIEKVIETSLKYENVKNDCEISVTIVDNDKIHKLNNKFRNIDRPTDVLSFPLIDFEKEGMPPSDQKAYLGDIVISIDKAKEQAREYGHSLEREISFLTAHSMLHLLGYDHMVEDEEKIMFQKQREILDIMGVKR